jgi:hypothetical protein
MKRRVIACLIALLSIANYSTYAQKAVLVKIASQKSRIEYFEKKGDTKNAKALRNDAIGIRKVTIADFQDHFTFCKVYYFIDTNLQKVLDLKFDGILLDKDLKPTDPVIVNGETDFLIVYYGTPDDAYVNQIDSTSYLSIRYPNDGLVVLGHDLKRVKGLDHFIFYNYPFRRKMKPYFYTSKHFTLDYKPMAGDLQNNLMNYRAFKHRKPGSMPPVER